MHAEIYTRRLKVNIYIIYNRIFNVYIHLCFEFRYFLLREGVPESDCNISVNKFPKFVNVELANTLGNLYQRCMPFNTQKTYPSYASISSRLADHERRLLASLDSLRSQCDEHFDSFNYYKAIQCIMTRLRDANALVQEFKPWEILKSDCGGGDAEGTHKIEKMLFIVYESLRVCGILLQPIVPNVSRVLLDKLNVSTDERFYEFAQVDRKRDQAKKISSNSDVIFKRILN